MQKECCSPFSISVSRSRILSSVCVARSCAHTHITNTFKCNHKLDAKRMKALNGMHEMQQCNKRYQIIDLARRMKYINDTDSCCVVAHRHQRQRSENIYSVHVSTTCLSSIYVDLISFHCCCCCCYYYLFISSFVFLFSSILYNTY